MNVIDANNLTKSYGMAVAVNDVSLKITKGEIYGFLGLNGAGKTTTMRMLLGMIKPTKGSIQLFGKRIQNFNWQNVGYMIESTHAYPNLSVFENLKVFSKYYGLKGTQAISTVISLLNISQYKHTKAEHLSLGNLQRLGLAKALLHEPELLILDEPVNGLDPAGIVEVRFLLKELSNRGVTILISSHLLIEVAKIAHTIGIIHQGRLICEINSNSLRQKIEKKLIIATLNNIEALQVLNIQGINAAVNSTGEIEISDTNILAAPEQMTKLLTEKNLPPKKLVVFEEELESYFLRIISKEQK